MIWVADAALLAILGWEFAQDEWASLNEWADDVEQQMPAWFRWAPGHDWLTWIHHLIWAALFTSVGALLGSLLGDWHEGARHWSLIAAAFYVVREWFGFWEAKRLCLDGFMDQVGPVLLAVLVWQL